MSVFVSAVIFAIQALCVKVMCFVKLWCFSWLQTCNELQWISKNGASEKLTVNDANETKGKAVYVGVFASTASHAFMRVISKGLFVCCVSFNSNFFTPCLLTISAVALIHSCRSAYNRSMKNMFAFKMETSFFFNCNAWVCLWHIFLHQGFQHLSTIPLTSLLFKISQYVSSVWVVI